MERLQSAIEKARARAPAAAAARPEATPAAPPVPEVDAAWEALPEVMLRPRQLRRRRILAFESSSESVPFDVLRTRLLRMTRERGWQRIGITSPSPSCGKSTLALNLAFAIARQKETRTILIEGDMRRPSLQKLLRTKSETSVAEMLQRRVRFEDTAFRVGSHLALATSLKASKNASDVLLSGAVPEVLSEIERTYAPGLMLFDLPPHLVNDDAMALLQHLDCVLLVAAAGTTTIAEIDRCERELAETTEVLGTVLNKCAYMPKEYGGYYYAGYE